MFKNSITIGMNKKKIYFPYSFYAKTQTPNALKYKYPIKKKKKEHCNTTTTPVSAKILILKLVSSIMLKWHFFSWKTLCWHGCSDTSTFAKLKQTLCFCLKKTEQTKWKRDFFINKKRALSNFVETTWI